MEREWILTPEELYYMGRLMQAKYIDYAYIAAMNDINHNYALFEKEAQASLVSKGLLSEDFSGNLELDANTAAVLRPIFFGEVESSVDICSVGDNPAVLVHKFHFHDGAVTMVCGDEDGKLNIKAVDQLAIRDLVTAILPESYGGAFAAVDGFDKDTITRFVAVKNILVGQTAIVNTYIEADGIMYRENGETIESVTRDMFIDDAYTVAKGA